ncbi:hypothetical protein BGY98DRAFT_1165832 [Russula aff. rugulosa BPL654]|nr:hypothetical protein BGY98DRAFT_1165832 [Russula aff. rugulosa BPL654]
MDRRVLDRQVHHLWFPCTSLTPSSFGKRAAQPAYPVEWATNEAAWPIHVAGATSVHTAPAKRYCDEFQRDVAPVVDGHELPPQKRVRDGKPNGILKAARSTPGTCHKPQAVASIPKKINREPKEAGRGAEKLRSPAGVGGRSCERTADLGRGSVEEMAHRTDSTVQQQECFEIPRDFKTGYRALLVATQANWARGAVREIKCRLCPKAKFKKWGEYKRHCDCTEMNLLLIYFCDCRWDRCCECDRVVRIREERKRMGKREKEKVNQKKDRRGRGIGRDRVDSSSTERSPMIESTD